MAIMQDNRIVAYNVPQYDVVDVIRTMPDGVYDVTRNGHVFLPLSRLTGAWSAPSLSVTLYSGVYEGLVMPICTDCAAPIVKADTYTLKFDGCYRPLCHEHYHARVHHCTDCGAVVPRPYTQCRQCADKLKRALREWRLAPDTMPNYRPELSQAPAGALSPNNWEKRGYIFPMIGAGLLRSGARPNMSGHLPSAWENLPTSALSS